MKKSDPLEPRVYLPSKSHPDYSQEETNYWISHTVPKKIRKMSRSHFLFPLVLPNDLKPAHVLVQYYIDEIGQGGKADEKDEYVIKAIKLFGEHPIELVATLNPFRLSDEANRLGGLVCRVLGSLSLTGVRGDYDTRKKAQKRLEKIVRGILPDARGKKRKTVDPLEVQVFYWKELFRLYHIHNTLRASGKNQSQKVKAASQNFDTPIEQIRDLWKLDEDDQLTGRPLTIKEMARILTDQHFGITQHRLSNILAS